MARPIRSTSPGPTRASDGRARLTIGEAARIVGTSPSTLRLWEHAGLVQTDRNRGGYRLYTPQSLSRLNRIKYLRDVRQLNVPAIKEALGSPARTDAAGSAAMGTRMRQLRQRRGLRITDAARGVGISTGFLSAVERGQATASGGPTSV